MLSFYFYHQIVSFPFGPLFIGSTSIYIIYACTYKPEMKWIQLPALYTGTFRKFIGCAFIGQYNRPISVRVCNVSSLAYILVCSAEQVLMITSTLAYSPLPPFHPFRSHLNRPLVFHFWNVTQLFTKHKLKIGLTNRKIFLDVGCTENPEWKQWTR